MSGEMFYKVLGDDRRPHHGGSGLWTPKRARSVKGELVACQNGIHYCRRDQLIHWLGPTIWTFEDLTPAEMLDAGGKLVTRRGRILKRLETWNEMTARLFAADCAELALQFIREQDRAPFVAAINAARGFARGEVSDAARSAAWSAAWSAARSAAESAAWSAARSAAWSAARSAAESAAWSAAWSAARSAAESAAWSAAWSAARSAAESAAWSAQTEILFDYLEGRRS